MVSPSGSATRMAMNVVSNVPETRDMIPNCLSANRGVHSLSVRKSIMETSLKNLIDSESSTNRIPKVVSTVIALHRNKSPSMIFSRIRMLIDLKLDFQPQTLYPEPYRQQHRFPRSEGRRVGKECVSTCRSRGRPYH